MTAVWRRRWPVAATVTAVMLSALPAAADAQAPAGDSVTGTGTAAFFGPFSIDAHSGPDGENATGQASFDTDEVLVDGPVSCLRVNGNVARFNLALSVRVTAVFQVTDNAALGIPDTIAGSISFGGVATDCSPLTMPARTGAVLSGDIAVVDAPPLPTSKDDCRAGGWRAFGTFRNQGDCVSFVATHGRNPPAPGG